MRVGHDTFMDAALSEAERALDDGEFPVGCVMVCEGDILAAGARENSKGEMVNEIDHAEIVTLRALLAEHSDIDLSKVVVYSTMEPCLMCLSTLLLSGIRTIVYGYEDVMGGGCGLEIDKLPPLYAEMKIEIIGGVKRDKSLKLFKSFFEKPENDYWQDSLLAKYTLEQNHN